MKNNYLYTPMPEMHNEMIPVTIGCSYSKCLFCDLNMGRKFYIYPLEEIKSYIKNRKEYYKDKRIVPKKFNLLEGNPLSLDTDFLEKVLETINEKFDIKYISMFARTIDIMNKSDQELLRLKDLKMDRLSIGIESGSDEVLNYHRKGIDSKGQLEALRRLESLGIDYSTYIMLGLGGKKWSLVHAEKTAEFLNKLNPFEVVLVTTVVFKGAALVEEVRNGNFQRLRVRETLTEERDLIGKLELNTILNASHKTNSLPLRGKLPEHKDLLIKKINEHLELSDRELLAAERKKWNIWDWEYN